MVGAESEDDAEMNDTPPPTPGEEQEDHLFAASEPLALFTDWFARAQESESYDPTAVALATATADAVPNVRMVLLKGFDERGFVFYTNLESRKGQEIGENPFAALCFHWQSLARQVRIQGPVSPVSSAEADEYFASRAKGSQIGAWASRQSRPLPSRFALEKEVARFTARFAFKDVERPPFWSGYRISPLRYEFWRHGAFRLHDRRVFRRDSPDQKEWTTERLFP
jgi:pyridoxamine 5'-phosphate oxidase